MVQRRIFVHFVRTICGMYCVYVVVFCAGKSEKTAGFVHFSCRTVPRRSWRGKLRWIFFGPGAAGHTGALVQRTMHTLSGRCLRVLRRAGGGPCHAAPYGDRVHSPDLQLRSGLVAAAAPMAQCSWLLYRCCRDPHAAGRGLPFRFSVGSTMQQRGFSPAAQASTRTSSSQKSSRCHTAACTTGAIRRGLPRPL